MAVTGYGVGVLKMTTQGDELLDVRLSISYIRWVNASSSNHVLEVTNGAGDTIFYSVADGANFIDLHPLFKIIDGIKIKTLSSGTVFVYLN